MNAIEYYIAAWNAETSEERYRLLMGCMAADATYVDPHISEPLHGREAMHSLIEQFRSRFDHQLEPEEAIDAHHNVFRLQWRLQRESGEILSRGLMVGELSEVGVITRIIQFVDAPIQV